MEWKTGLTLCLPHVILEGLHKLLNYKQYWFDFHFKPTKKGGRWGHYQFELQNLTPGYAVIAYKDGQRV